MCGGGGGGGRHVLHLLASSCSCLMCIGSFAGATRPETFEADEAALFSHHCCYHSGLVSGCTPLSTADTVAATHEGDHNMTDECLPGPISTSLCSCFRYFVTGDSVGDVKFFDSDLKLINWCLPCTHC